MSDDLVSIDAFLDDLADTPRAERRYLHAHPEASLNEFQTTVFLARQFDVNGIPWRSPESERGIIAGPECEPGTSRIAFRGDIDALRMTDLKEVSYRSTVDGLLHGCGHDAHAVMTLGAARALWACRESLPWPVPWRAILQPAEEVGTGAQEMIDAGALGDVRAIVALHVDPFSTVGKVGYRAGVLCAACSDLVVTIIGKGGHAARPHDTVDPIAAMAQFVSAVYSVVPREVDALEAVVVTFGSVRGGELSNVIPNEVQLLGTIRTQSFKTADKVAEIIRRIARGVGESTRATILVRIEGAVGPVINDDRVTGLCAEVASALLGQENVQAIDSPSMGAEDFAGYLRHVPGCMMRLGVADADKPMHPLHSPYFDLDERALVIGAKLLARSVIAMARPDRLLSWTAPAEM